MASGAMVFTPETTPFRLHTHALALAHDGDFNRVLAEVKEYPKLNTENLFFTDHAKLFTDGAFFSQLMMVGEPAISTAMKANG